MAVITISGEPGSPSEEVAARVAGRLGFSLVDKARLARLAHEIDLDETKLDRLDEAWSIQPGEIDSETKACAELLQELVAQLAEEEDVVIVNLGAQGLFRNRPGSLHVQLIAPRAFRVSQFQTLENLSEREARKKIKELEFERRRHLRLLYRLHPGDPGLYDITLRMDRLSIEQGLELIITAFEKMGLRQVPRGRIVRDLLSEVPEKNGEGRYVNAAEMEFAAFLEFYRIPFEYEPRTFTLETDSEGRVTEAFTPDFYLPDQDLYIELTTMKQSLVTRKNRKVRKLRRLYPDVNIRIFYQRDYYNLLAKYGLLSEKRTTDE